MTAPATPDLNDSAVTAAFPQAVGLQDLVTSAPPASNGGASQQPSPAPVAPTAPVIPAVEFGPRLFLNALRLADVLASNALKVAPEDEKTMEELAGAIAPLVQYYGGKNSTVAALWGNLILALVGVGYSKAVKVKAQQPKPEGSTNGPEA